MEANPFNVFAPNVNQFYTRALTMGYQNMKGIHDLVLAVSSSQAHLGHTDSLTDCH